MSSTIKQRKSIHRQLLENDQRIKNLELQIRAAQKLASLGTMACLVAHEFNNILAPIISYSELALKHDDDPQLMRKALEKTVKHGNRAALIVQSMLGMVREQAENFEPVPLHTIVSECFQCLARDFQKDRIHVKLDIPPDLLVCAAANQIQQVMLNLIINARQAMLDHGGTLTISACQPNDSTIRIDVADTGTGIPPALLDKIFEPFFSTKTNAARPDQKGTGLGLSVCKDIIEAHQGAITVTSQLHKGSTFTITLPAASRNP